MKFILCADLHLDSRLESNLRQDDARKRRRELLETFRRILEYAEQQQVSAVVCAGDLFDEKRAGAASREFVLNQIAAHPGITFLYLRGNHDSGFGGLPLPENIRTFSSDSGWVSHRFGSVVFWGSEHLGDAGIYELFGCDPQDFNVVVLHGQVNSSASVPAPDTVCLKLLKNREIDLLALGHLHSLSGGRLDQRGKYRYPGCPDGRGFDECGEKGILLFEVGEDHSLTETFVSTSSRMFHRVEVKMDGSLSYSDVEDRVLSATKEISGDHAVYVELTGSRLPETRIDTAHLEALLAPRYWCVRVKDRTVLSLNPEEYMGDISLKGEFVRLVQQSRFRAEEKDRILATGLHALRGEEID